MRNNWLFFMDLDGRCPYTFSPEPFSSHVFWGHLLSHFSSIVDNSFYQSRHFYVPGLQQAYNRVSKFAGALLSGKLQGSRHGGTFCVQNFLGLYCGSWSRVESAIPLFVGKIASSTMTHIWKELEQIQSFPVLSLAAALVPPFDSLSAKVLAMPLENSDVLVNSHMDQTHCIRRHQGSSELSLHEINWTRDAVEPVTGIEFPTVLDNILAGKKNSSLRSEVLVGTGSKIMRIIKVKSLKLYAFGLYVQPDSICKKLGRKYASVPVGELSNQPEFFEDLLREDLDMTVRLVVNYKGLKINIVRDAFESSLRARLQKMNPEPDYHCLRTFGSCFSQDISLPPVMLKKPLKLLAPCLLKLTVLFGEHYFRAA